MVERKKRVERWGEETRGITGSVRKVKGRDGVDREERE